MTRILEGAQSDPEQRPCQGPPDSLQFYRRCYYYTKPSSLCLRYMFSIQVLYVVSRCHCGFHENWCGRFSATLFDHSHIRALDLYDAQHIEDSTETPDPYDVETTSTCAPD